VMDGPSICLGYEWMNEGHVWAPINRKIREIKTRETERDLRLLIADLIRFLDGDDSDLLTLRELNGSFQLGCLFSQIQFNGSLHLGCLFTQMSGKLLNSSQRLFLHFSVKSFQISLCSTYASNGRRPSEGKYSGFQTN
jgi:hypothetical protein